MVVTDMRKGEGEVLPASGLSFAGNGGACQARAQMGTLRGGERIGVDTAAAPSLPTP